MNVTVYNGSITFFIVFALILLFSVAITVAIGVFVYRDAKKRGMNAALWTLVVLITPTMIGLIIYLVVRSDRDVTNTVCVACGNNVEQSFNRCPYCSNVLKPQCPNCGQHIAAGWYICPKCGEELSEELRVHTTERVGGSDRGLTAILIGVIVVPIVLIILVLVLSSVYLFGEVNVSDSVLNEESVGIVAQGTFVADIAVSDDVTSIYSAAVTFYTEAGKTIENHVVSNADGAYMREISLYVNIPDAAEYCIIEFFGASDELLCDTGVICLDNTGMFIEGAVFIDSGKLEFEF